MSKLLISIILLFNILILSFFFLSTSKVSAMEIFTYTLSEVKTHNTENSCWMVFENKVYDVTSQLRKHDSKMDIRDWCGKDMTQDFKDKAGRNEDHKASTYTLLKDFYIGDIKTTGSNTVRTNSSSSSSSSESIDDSEEDEYSTENEVTSNGENTNTNVQPKNPYNFVLPFGVVFFLYIITLFASKNSVLGKHFTKIHLNLLWNTVLVLSLIPSVLFGFFMIFRYSFPELDKIDFNFLYWHVEGSIIFGTIVLMHFIHRLSQYLTQVKAVKNMLVVKKEPQV